MYIIIIQIKFKGDKMSLLGKNDLVCEKVKELLEKADLGDFSGSGKRVDTGEVILKVNVETKPCDNKLITKALSSSVKIVLGSAIKHNGLFSTKLVDYITMKDEVIHIYYIVDDCRIDFVIFDEIRKLLVEIANKD